MEAEFELTPEEAKEIVNELNALMSRLPERTRRLLKVSKLLSQLEEWVKQNESA